MSINDEYYKNAVKQEAQRRLWNIEDWLLRTAGSKEEAQKIAQYLITVNWDQTVARQKEDQARWDEQERQEIQKTIEGGGGYCHNCKKLVNTLIEFNHPEVDVKYKSDYEGDLCIECLNKTERHFQISVDEWTRQCEGCYKPYPIKSLFKHPKVEVRWSGFCIDCFDPLLKAAYITCIGCGKHTLEYGSSKSVCLECHSKYPDWALVQSHLGRAKKVDAPATLTVAAWTATVHHFNGKCAYCNKRKYQVLEHYKPISLLGGTVNDNCLPACNRCNGTKGDLHPDDFEPLFPSENIARIKAYFASL